MSGRLNIYIPWAPCSPYMGYGPGAGYFDEVGDTVIVSLAPRADKRAVADAILSSRKNARRVLNKVSKVEGDRRVPSYEVIAGDNTVVTYKEFGFVYRFDIAKAFFNGRLGYERHRIAGLVAPGEKVLIPFCGVGPYVIPIAARGCRVAAVDSNRDACAWLRVNARANGVAAHVDILNADATRLTSTLRASFDRAVIPAPYGMDVILGTLAPMVRNGGALHFYTFKKKYQVESLKEQYEDMGMEVEHHRRCGNVAPGVSRWAFDLKKK